MSRFIIAPGSLDKVEIVTGVIKCQGTSNVLLPKLDCCCLFLISHSDKGLPFIIERVTFTDALLLTEGQFNLSPFDGFTICFVVFFIIAYNRYLPILTYVNTHLNIYVNTYVKTYVKYTAKQLINGEKTDIKAYLFIIN